MGVVLSERTHSGQSVQLAALLVAIYRAELRTTERQLLVGAGLGGEDHTVVGAVHRLEQILLTLFGRGDGAEGVRTVVGPVAGSHIELLAADVGRDHLLVAVALLNLLKEILQAQTQRRALREPDRQALAHHIAEHEELHLLADLAVVALLGFFQQLEIFLQHLLLGERDGVDSRHLRTLLVAAPVSGRGAEHLEGLDGRGGHEVRTATQIRESALGVGRDVTVFQVGNELVLIRLPLVAEELQRIALGDVATHKGLLALHQLHHLLFDVGEDRLADHHALSGHDVVVESVFNGRTDTELSAGIELLQGLGHKVGGSVPEGVLALFVLPLVKLDGGIFRDGAVQFHRLTVHAASQHILSQSAADALCNLQTRHTGSVFTHAAVGKSNLNHISNKQFRAQR